MRPLRLTTTVLAGHRLEIVAPELDEGSRVEVTISSPSDSDLDPGQESMLEFIKTVQPGPAPFATWEEYEAALQIEKDAWDR